MWLLNSWNVWLFYQRVASCVSLPLGPEQAVKIFFQAENEQWVNEKQRSCTPNDEICKLLGYCKNIEDISFSKKQENQKKGQTNTKCRIALSTALLASHLLRKPLSGFPVWQFEGCTGVGAQREACSSDQVRERFMSASEWGRALVNHLSWSGGAEREGSWRCWRLSRAKFVVRDWLWLPECWKWFNQTGYHHVYACSRHFIYESVQLQSNIWIDLWQVCVCFKGAVQHLRKKKRLIYFPGKQ